MKDSEKSNQAIENLGRRIGKKKKRILTPYREFLELASEKPEMVFRNIQQRAHDMVKHYVGEGEDEYPQDEESVGYLAYDCSQLFVAGTDKHFFADRFFSNSLMKMVTSFREGDQQNKIYSFLGPRGCGKSTFANILLAKFEDYSRAEKGAGYEIVWELEDIVQTCGEKEEQKLFYVPCPCHDHPISIIPVEYREEFIDFLLPNSEFKSILSRSKEYEWMFRVQPCTICSSLFEALMEESDEGSLWDVLKHVFVRSIKYNRRISDGIAVLHPGEIIDRNSFVKKNRMLQKKLDNRFGDSNKVQYVHSRFARTNNGIYVLMDVKQKNVERFIELHNILSEGINKAEDIEESVNTLFIALMNPEDKEDKEIKKMESLHDRIYECSMNYVTEVDVETGIYRDIFGDIDSHFLPRVLDNFARIIIATRMMHYEFDDDGEIVQTNAESKALIDWLGKDRLQMYANRYRCDPHGVLIRQEISAGIIPDWVIELDKKKFVASLRRKLLKEIGQRAIRGITGRSSINLFGKIFSVAVERDKPIAMKDVIKFFRTEMADKKAIAGGKSSMPPKFLDNLESCYDFTVVQEIQECLFHYNDEQIRRDILNYIFAVNYDLGSTEKCPYTGDTIEVTVDLLKNTELRLMPGREKKTKEIDKFRKDVVSEFTKLLARGDSVENSKLFKILLGKYTQNLKERVFDPFIENDNFRKAIKAYGDESVFKTFDDRIRRDVSFLIQNLAKGPYGTEERAKEICLYAIENEIIEIYA